MICDKCGKEYKSQVPFDKHVETCTGKVKPEVVFPNPNPGGAVAKRVAAKYEGMLALSALGCLALAKMTATAKPEFSNALLKDVLTINREKKNVASGVGMYAENHTWVEPAIAQVEKAFGIFTLASIHLALVQGVAENHLQELQSSNPSTNQPEGPTNAEWYDTGSTPSMV
jgi:hypothetical protein